MESLVDRQYFNSLLGIPLPWFLRLLLYTSGFLIILNALSLFFPAEISCVPVLSSTNLSSTSGWLNTRCNVATEFGENRSNFEALNAAVFIAISLLVALLFFITLAPHFENVRNIVALTEKYIKEKKLSDLESVLSNPIANMSAGAVRRSYTAFLLSVILCLVSIIYIVLLLVYGIPLTKNTSFDCTVCADFNTSQFELKNEQCDTYRSHFLYGSPTLNSTTFIYVQALCSVDHIMPFRLAALFIAAILLVLCFVRVLYWSVSFGAYIKPSNWYPVALESTLMTLYSRHDSDNLDAFGLNLKGLFVFHSMRTWMNDFEMTHQKYAQAMEELLKELDTIVGEKFFLDMQCTNQLFKFAEFREQSQNLLQETQDKDHLLSMHSSLLETLSSCEASRNELLRISNGLSMSCYSRITSLLSSAKVKLSPYIEKMSSMIDEHSSEWQESIFSLRNLVQISNRAQSLNISCAFVDIPAKFQSLFEKIDSDFHRLNDLGIRTSHLELKLFGRSLFENFLQALQAVSKQRYPNFDAYSDSDEHSDDEASAQPVDHTTVTVLETLL